MLNCKQNGIEKSYKSNVLEIFVIDKPKITVAVKDDCNFLPRCDCNIMLKLLLLLTFGKF